MRPLELSVEGFGPFRDRVDIDFSDSDFFALVGPTGAGKSSVIDAICFALYGLVPRYEDARLVAPALTTGVLQARIQFRFQVGGARYVVTRVVRRTARGGATTKECRLERVEPDSQVLAGDAPSASRAVAEVIGLSPEHFTRCVVLPQGEFARFLHDLPSQRQRLLVELLGLEVYSRMAAAARARAAEGSTRVAALAGQLADLEQVTPESLRAAQGLLERIADLGAQVAAAAPEVAEATTTISALERELAATEALAQAVDRVVVPPAVADRAALIEQARAADAAARAQSEAAEAAARAAEGQAAGFPDPALLAGTLAEHRQLAEAVRQQAKGNEHAQAAQRAAEESACVADQLGRVLEAARAGLRSAERTHAAHALAADLQPGQPCPVCLVPVREVPERAAPAELAEAQAEVSRAEAGHRAALAEERRRAATSEAAQAELARIRTLIAGLRERLADAPATNEIEALITEQRQAAATARALRLAASAAGEELAGTNRRLAELLDQQRRAESGFTGQRDAVAALAPPPPTGDLAADWSRLAAWARDRATELGGRADELAARLAGHRAGLAATTKLLTQRCLDAGVTLPPRVGYEDLGVELARAEAAQLAARDQVRRDLARRDELLAERKALQSQVEVASTMGQLLGARGFESWVLSEALSQLVAGASVTLRELSGGAYSLGLSDGNDFVVIDHREADAIRPARTLSGGETFQASLALALALSDQLGSFAAGGASRLESIFLDEGFGTLDEDSLEMVAATLETLASGNRVVGVVTHVKELAERVPVRFEVRKVGRTASVQRATS